MRATGRMWAAACVAAVALAVGGPAVAGLITLADGNATLQIDPDTSAGVLDWSIGTTTNLDRQWFWFRNDLPEWSGREYSVDEIGTPVVFQTPAVPNLAILTYTDAQNRFSIQLTYMLTGGAGSRTADLMENVKVTNLGDTTLTFDIFQYSDFSLGGDSDDYSVRITGGNRAVQTGYGPGVTLSETVTTGSPDLSEVGMGIYPTTLEKLTDSDIDDLSGSTVLYGPADLTWAFQWSDRSIAPGHAFIISKDKLLTVQPVPEPAGLGLIGLALLALRKRRS